LARTRAQLRSSPIPSSMQIWPVMTRTVCCAYRRILRARDRVTSCPPPSPRCCHSLEPPRSSTRLMAGVSPRCGWRRERRLTERGSTASAPPSSTAAITSVASLPMSSRSRARG
jgi:hypothetical protein